MAYYRKCIALKRRLTAVEQANDAAKLRRVRLDRAVMKMRLERAFLLDELRRRADYDVEASDGSGDEGLATPPQDRPQRDKRRRTTGNTPAGGPEQEESVNGAQAEMAGQTQTSQQAASQQQVPLPGNPYARQRSRGGAQRRDRGGGNHAGEDVEMGEEEGDEVEEDDEDLVEAAPPSARERGGSRSRREGGARSSSGRASGFAAVNGDD
jgi:hypothetical protein